MKKHRRGRFSALFRGRALPELVRALPQQPNWQRRNKPDAAGFLRQRREELLARRLGDLLVAHQVHALDARPKE